MVKEKIKKRGLKKCLVGTVIGIAVVGVLIVTVPKLRSKNGVVTTVAKSSLEKIKEINELSTVRYTYNAIAKVYDGEGEKKSLKYYVAYEGTVTAGIDFNKIDFIEDEKNKTFTIVVPEPVIQTTDVDMSKLDFIFESSKYETENVTQEAYKASLADLEQRAAEDEAMMKMARENAVSTVEALFEPWMKQMKKEYQIEVK